MKTDLHGRRLGGRYTLESRLDVGGMAEVWRGRDEVLGRDVAVKVLHDELGTDENVFDRFRREAVSAAQLSHPAVVRVFDTGVDEGTCYIVMELVEGRTLADLVEGGPLEVSRAVGIVRRILDALGHAHAMGIVHRDVKPHNVLLDEEEGVKVTDFGIAKAAFAGGDLTTTGKLLGTARYLAPEQVTGDKVDGRADLYAAGIVLYELLTGRVPFQAETVLATATMRLSAEPPSPASVRSGIPRDVDSAVRRALARSPEDRFQSAEEMSAALDRHGHHPAPMEAPADPAPPPPSAREDRSFFRSWMLVPVIVVFLGAAVVGLGLLFGKLEVGGPLGVRPPGEGGSGERLRILEAFDHDPGGDNGAENTDLVGLAIDGDDETAWETEGYNTADLGGAKSGVGLILDLGRPRRITRVTLQTTIPGWRFQLQGAVASAFDPPLRDVDGERTFEMDAEKRTVRLEEAVEYRSVLVWITWLGPDDGRFRASIAEAEVFGG